MGYTDRLAQLRKTLERSREISTELENMRPYREALKQKIKALKRSLDKEELEVGILKDDKLSALILNIRGKLNDRMEKEKSEALAIKLKYEQSQKELADLDGRIAVLTEEQTSLEGCRPEYEQLFEQIRQRLIREESTNSQKTAALSNELNLSKSRFKDIRGALETGENVLTAMEEAYKIVKESEENDEMGMQGVLGMIIDKADYNDYVDAFVEEMIKVQTLFTAFKAEAAKVEAMQDISVTTGFLVADVLFDDLTAKGHYSDRLEDSKAGIETIKSEIYCDMLKLKQLLEKAQQSLSGLTAQLDEMVLEAAE